MSAVITKDGENLIARCQAEGRVLKIDKMIIGNVPGVDPLADIDRDIQKPTAEQIVDELVIPEEYKAYVNPNQVVYSIVMDANRGNYDFNWIGLYSSEDDVVVAITTLPTLAKYKTEGQIQGNHLTRNFMLEYFGAKESTGMSVAAETWQLDHSARLGGMDERIRLIGRDLFGDSVFWQDGWKLVKEGESYKLLPGVGYVEGIKIDLAEALPISGEYAPKYVWLDVSLQPQGSEVVPVAVPVFGMNFETYTKDGITHYFEKIAKIEPDGSCKDYRKVEAIQRSFFDYFRDVQKQLENGLTIPAIEQPRNVSPVEGAVDVQDPVTFTFSVPRSLFGKKIVAVEFELGLDANMQNISYSETITLDNPTGEVTFTAPGGTVQEGKPFWWWFRYVDEDGAKSEYSVATGFSTALVFEYVVPPTVVFPVSGTEDVKAPLKVKLSDFVAFNTEDTHAASKLEASYDGFQTIFWNSEEIAPGVDIEITEENGLLVSKDLSLRGYHKGTRLGMSEAGPVCTVRTADTFNVFDGYDASLNSLPTASLSGSTYAYPAVVNDNEALIFGGSTVTRATREPGSNVWTETVLTGLTAPNSSITAAVAVDENTVIAYAYRNGAYVYNRTANDQPWTMSGFIPGYLSTGEDIEHNLLRLSATEVVLVGYFQGTGSGVRSIKRTSSADQDWEWQTATWKADGTAVRYFPQATNGSDTNEFLVYAVNTAAINLQSEIYRWSRPDASSPWVENVAAILTYTGLSNWPNAVGITKMTDTDYICFGGYQSEGSFIKAFRLRLNGSTLSNIAEVNTPGVRVVGGNQSPATAINMNGTAALCTAATYDTATGTGGGLISFSANLIGETGLELGPLNVSSFKGGHIRPSKVDDQQALTYMNTYNVGIQYLAIVGG